MRGTTRLVAIGLAGALLGFVPAACSTGGRAATSPASSTRTSASGGDRIELQVYAAASLKAALAVVASRYATTEPGTSVVISTDSSAALETKIEQGAPADVFLSADTASPQRLVDAGLASAVVPFATNTLAIVVAPTNPAGIRTPADLARGGVKIVAAGDRVPISGYARQLVDNLARLPGYPPDFALAYARNVVSKEDNVAGVVAKVALGEGDAGIVYRTDAADRDVDAVEVPADATVRATYGGVVVRASSHPDAARQFLEWLRGPDGRALLSSFGFLPGDAGRGTP